MWLREPGSGRVSVFRDGDLVNLGGAPAGRIKDFVRAPHRECPTGDAFLVLQAATRGQG
ncbi:hypothetical protein [Actinoplanes sp. OR16]|uniref:hypothetical protein n=1 Tax=Actinoplanes sp. OR16 TaxID=946334 RepID=UPI00135F1A78|nr:hypothetical protein [Actinoplanes sp. OR16]